MRFFRERRRPLIVGTLIGCLAALGFLTGMGKTWSARFSDRLFLSRAPDDSIVIIAIDDASLGQIGRWPWPRDVHAQIIQNLAQAGARVIAYDVNFSEPSSGEEGIEQDRKLVDVIRQAGNVVLPVELTLVQQRDSFVFDKTRTVVPLSMIGQVVRATGHTNTPPDSDGAVRRVPLFVSSPDGSRIWAFAAESLRVAGKNLDSSFIPHDTLLRVTVNYNGEPKSTFPTLSAFDVWRGNFPPHHVKDKTVFIGSTAPDLHDEQLVPTSNGMPMPGVEIHASFYDTLLTERWLRPVPRSLEVLSLVFLGFLVGVAVSSLRARYSLLLLVATWIMILLVGFYLFDRGWILDLVWPTLALAASYAAVTLERRLHAEHERFKVKDAFSRYVSPAVIHVLLQDTSKLRLGGEKRRMSVLFSDVRGFTSLSEKTSPEVLVDIMNTYLSRMTDIVFKEEGVLDKYIGDAVMAFWNAPLDQPDHALRSVRAALSMQRELARMNQEKIFPEGIELKVGIGINTGDMIVGNMGSEMRFDYTVIGDNVNLASRIEGITKEYGVGVLITESTKQEIEESILTRRIDKVAVKGKKEPVFLYEAMNIREETIKEQEALVKFFEEAFKAYSQREFSIVIEACEMLLKTYPNDGPTRNLLERARMFLSNPPPEDWDGTWVMTKK